MGHHNIDQKSSRVLFSHTASLYLVHMCIAPATQLAALGIMDDNGACAVLRMQHDSEAVCEKGTGASSRPTMKSPFRGLSWDRKNNG